MTSQEAGKSSRRAVIEKNQHAADSSVARGLFERTRHKGHEVVYLPTSHWKLFDHILTCSCPLRDSQTKPAPGSGCRAIHMHRLLSRGCSPQRGTVTNRDSPYSALLLPEYVSNRDKCREAPGRSGCGGLGRRGLATGLALAGG